MAGALEGLLVADFSRVLAGPYATMLLADLGADVVKVERPEGGDDTRSWGPPYAGGAATYFLAVNRNKRSVALDLGDGDDLAAARALAERADVIVENFRPGTMDRLGLGHDDVRRANPAVVYCSVTGFGSGPGAALPGYDLLVQAVGGLMSVTGSPGEPTKVGVALVDVLTGLHAAVGILGALRHRDRTGEGQRLEVSLLSCLLSSLVNQASAYVGAGVVPTAMGNLHPSVAPYQVFGTADRPIVVGAGNDRQFRALCEVVGAPDLADDPRFATNDRRVARQDELARIIGDRLLARPAEEWFAALNAARVPCGPINDLPAAFSLAAELELGPIVEVAGAGMREAARQVANPIRLSATPPTYRLAPPGLGEHNAEVAAWLRSGTDP